MTSLHYPSDPSLFAQMLFPIQLAAGIFFGYLLLDLFHDITDDDEPDGYT
jgi:hypothetical protein